MKHTLKSLLLPCALLEFALLLFTGCKNKSQNNATKVDTGGTVIAYTYDSFANEWGPGDKIAKLFKEKTGYTIEFVNCGKAMQALNKAILEKNNVQADIIIGLDNTNARLAKTEDILQPYAPQNIDSIIDSDIINELESDNLITPYDYGYFALIYNSLSDIPAPTSLQDLIDPVYEKQIILMDPRTSTPGLGFLAWTISALKDDYKTFWKQLRPNILTMSSGWSEGWGMFLKGEAPLVISYTTSPAYNVEYEDNDRFKTLIFEQGHVCQIEGLAILKGAHNIEGAKKFVDFMITKEAQDLLPLTQWMYPVNKEASLPDSYKIAAPLPDKMLHIENKKTLDSIDTVIGILEN